MRSWTRRRWRWGRRGGRGSRVRGRGRREGRAKSWPLLGSGGELGGGEQRRNGGRRGGDIPIPKAILLFY